jgi:peptidoglycan/LPS O-acetylase OafA/YrhL
MIQLDSLRGLAVLTVMFEHYVPSGSSSLFYWKPILDLGISAVTLFFVLNGFLITGILLRCRDTINRSGDRASFGSPDSRPPLP